MLKRCRLWKIKIGGGPGDGGSRSSGKSSLNTPSSGPNITGDLFTATRATNVDNNITVIGSSPSDVTSIGQKNYTSTTNSLGTAEEGLKWGRNHKKRKPGIPKLARQECQNIRVIHESHSLYIAHRGPVNEFYSNQYLVVSKKNLEAVFIDMSDDWPEEWIRFLEYSGVDMNRVSVFFTHLHLDNVLGISEFCARMNDATADDAKNIKQNNLTNGKRHHGIYQYGYNPSDADWASSDWFRKQCLRYRRDDLIKTVSQLPFATPSVVMNSANPNQVMYFTCNSDRTSTFYPLGDGDRLMFHIWTPGHSMGHTIFHIPQEKILFTGDLLFYDQIGRVDVPQGSGARLAQSLRMLEEFPDDTLVLAGHGRHTSLGRERRENRDLRRLYELLETGAQLPKAGLSGMGYF